jgi:hypothetical protein
MIEAMKMPLALVVIAGVATAAQTPAATDDVIRGCLHGSTLTHIEPVRQQDPALQVPDVLRVSSLKVIRPQVKALSGHQVELIGSLYGIPGQDRGMLVSDGKAKVYVGGGDPKLGEDLKTQRDDPPSMYVRTIKDLADTCPAAAPSASAH